MFPRTDKRRKIDMISFRLRTKWQNCRGYVPRYERTPKNGWFDIHSVFATHSEDLMFNNICFYNYINSVSFFGWHTDCSLGFLEQGKFFASGRIMGNCPVNFLWD